MAGPDDLVTVEVVYALPGVQRVVGVRLPPGSTVRQAVEAAGLEKEFPGLDVAGCPVGIYGRVVPDDHGVREGDRVEVYRPLARDPREARRAAAARGEVLGGRRPVKRPG